MVSQRRIRGRSEAMVACWTLFAVAACLVALRTEVVHWSISIGGDPLSSLNSVLENSSRSWKSTRPTQPFTQELKLHLDASDFGGASRMEGVVLDMIAKFPHIPGHTLVRLRG